MNTDEETMGQEKEN